MNKIGSTRIAETPHSYQVSNGEVFILLRRFETPIGAQTLGLIGRQLGA